MTSIYDSTCITVANLLGSDSPPTPTPVHTLCWEREGISGGYHRVIAAQQFVVNGILVGPSIPRDATCWFCKKPI